jgi:hypothetical protein
VLQGSILGPLLFPVYINDLPEAIEHKAIPILFANGTSILITSPNNIQFQGDLNVGFGQLNKWFKTNLLAMNFLGGRKKKTYFIQFTNKGTCTSEIQITYEDKHYLLGYLLITLILG